MDNSLQYSNIFLVIEKKDSNDNKKKDNYSQMADYYWIFC